MLIEMGWYKGLLGGLTVLSLLAITGVAGPDAYVEPDRAAAPKGAGLTPDEATIVIRHTAEVDRDLFGLRRPDGPAIDTGALDLETTLSLFDPDGSSRPGSPDYRIIWSQAFFDSLGAGRYYVALDPYAPPPLSVGGEILPYVVQVGP